MLLEQKSVENGDTRSVDQSIESENDPKGNTSSETIVIQSTERSTGKSDDVQSNNDKKVDDQEEVPPGASAPGEVPTTQSASTASSSKVPSSTTSIHEELPAGSVIGSNTNVVANSATGSVKGPPILRKKTDVNNPTFSRSSVSEKTGKISGTTKSMIVETETVDSSNIPSVTLPIAASTIGSQNSDLINGSSNSTNLSSLRSKRSALFVDQNPQLTVQQTSNAALDNDNVSITGSIRNRTKHLNPTENHGNITKAGATKADLFAAKIANAVGDASDSDSEETFVYESTPDAVSTLPAVKSITSTGSVNAKAMRNQRNLSMPMSSTHISSPLNTPLAITSNDAAKERLLSTFPSEDETETVKTPPHEQHTVDKTSIDNTWDKDEGSLQNQSEEKVQGQDEKSQQQCHEQGQQEQQPIESSQNEEYSHNVVKLPVTNQQQLGVKLPDDKSRSTSTTSFSGYKTNFHTATNNNNNNNTNNNTNNNSQKESQLRTTTSKLFDIKGSTLRRYSGVPDDVNIEDYIDRYDEEQEIGSPGGYPDFYDYDEYEDEDELTPLNVSRANNNLRNKASRHYLPKKSLNYGAVGANSADNNGYIDALAKDDPNGRGLRGKKSKLRSNYQYLQQEQNSPHDFFNSRKHSKLQMIKNTMYVFMFVFGLLAFGFIAGFFLATTKDLQDVAITTVDDILVSNDELVFDMSVQAFNPGFVTIEVSDLELDIFAKSAFVDKFPQRIPIFDQSQSESQTVLLGTASKFEIPLEFASGLFSRERVIAKSAIKLLNPGRNSTGLDSDKDDNHKVEDDSDKWKEIIEHPFELIIRGSLKYEIPLFGTPRSIPVTKSVAVDPDADDQILRKMLEKGDVKEHIFG